ncbi:MAG: hypothetical protein P8184_09730 [Calditrichia bacterium]
MKIQFGILILIDALILIISTGCEHNSTSPPGRQETPEDDSWTIYTPYAWEHDGEPYESVSCTVYSDAAGEEMKMQLGEIADERFNEILTLFNFNKPSDFVYPPRFSKIEIYLNRNHPENIAWAYWGGFIITIRSPQISGHWYDYTVYTSGHELTHIFEFLIEGREVLGSEVWFREGIAVYTGCLGGNAFKTINSLNELESWISDNGNVPGEGNPIKICQIEDFPPDADWTGYYRFFELAVRYILDEKGVGKSYRDVLNLFYDLRKGASFPASFERNFGITVSEYENEFYDRMRIYLRGGQ